MLGPTASGKSAFALDLAERLDAPLLSVDSMQVYRHMNIGTAKPSAADRQRVMHRLIDLVDPEQEFSLADFQRAGEEVLAEFVDRPVVICGGSGLYFRSLVDPMTLAPSDPAVRAHLEATPLPDLVAELVGADAEAARHVDMANPHRVVRAVEVWRISGRTPSERVATPEYRAWAAFEPKRRFVAVGVDPGEALARRATERFDGMLAAGLLVEVSGLQHRLGRTASQAVGYKELLPVARGEIDIGEGRRAAISATVALAKRQRTFFRKDPRIRWVEWHHDRAKRFARLWSSLGITP